MNEYESGGGYGGIFLVALVAAVIVALVAGGLIVAYNYSPGVQAAAQVRVAEAEARTAAAQAQAQAAVAQSQAYETGQTVRQQSYLAFLAAAQVMAENPDPVPTVLLVGVFGVVFYKAMDRLLNRPRHERDIQAGGNNPDAH